MIPRFFYRFRACLLVFIFITLNISVPNNQGSEENHLPATVISKNDATAVTEPEEFSFEIDCLLEIIIEESLALYDLFPEGDWSTKESTFAVVAEYDIISQRLVLPRLYPPRAKRLLAKDTALPDSRSLETPTLPPEMTL